jgi:hypothetical protein
MELLNALPQADIRFFCKQPSVAAWELLNALPQADIRFSLRFFFFSGSRQRTENREQLQKKFLF